MPLGEDCLVVNRTTKPLNYTYDGVPGILRPGYRRDGGKIAPAGRNGEILITHLPFSIAEMARRQNVVMGTENPYDPADVQYLVGIAVRDPETNALSPAARWPFNRIDYMEQGDATERLDRSLLLAKDQGAVVMPSRAYPRTRGAAGGGEGFKAGNDAPVHTDRGA